MTIWKEVVKLEKRVWINSGIVEELDKRQVRLLKYVLEKVQYYYRELYGTRPCYRHPLSLSRLMRLTKRNSHTVSAALKYLANSVPLGSKDAPSIHYDRGQSSKNKSHRPYRIFLRKKYV